MAGACARRRRDRLHAGVHTGVGPGSRGVERRDVRGGASHAGMREPALRRRLQPGRLRAPARAADALLRRELRHRPRWDGADARPGQRALHRACGARSRRGSTRTGTATAPGGPPARTVCGGLPPDAKSGEMTDNAAFTSVDAVQQAFAAENYIADRPLALTVMLAAQLEKPVLLEGEAGVGKTDVAKVI